MSVRQQHIEPVDPRTFTALLEQLQEGYVSAVAATAGCIMEPISRDLYGLDAWIIRPPKTIGGGVETMLGVQLKNTTQIRPDPSKETFSYQFSERKYLEALAIPRKYPKVVGLIMASPPQQASWSHGDHNSLQIEHCCYWENLENYRIRDGVSSPSVRIRTANIFDANSLTAMMDKLERGEDLG